MPRGLSQTELQFILKRDFSGGQQEKLLLRLTNISYENYETD
jgi:hypothetical protein